MSDTQNSYKIKRKSTDEGFILPKKLISKLADAGECELKALLVLASLGDGSFTEEEIFSELEKVGASACDLAESLAFLRGAGLIEKAVKKDGCALTTKPVAKKDSVEVPVEHRPSSKPSYTSKQLAQAANGGDFRLLVEWASRRLGKTFNTSELSTLYSFCDYLCLPKDVIMLGIEHCVEEGKPSLRYAEKLLIDFADREINTYQKAEDYILQRKKYLSFEGRLRTLMGLGQRALTAKEKAMLTQWQNDGVSDELIRLAYEKTVEKTGKVSMSYMHKILESWHSAGFKTVAEVEKGDKKPTDSNGSFDPEEFFRIAVESSKKK